ncbi:hypothetical protein [Mesorhizobium sp. M1295]|uniref:hypothetical protein n=1 Tax=Mesorhizobium sp. M1295 TaxID=2957076 RepID=UPI00333D7A5F
MIFVAKFNAVRAYNIIRHQVEIAGTVRILASGVQDFTKRRFRQPLRALRAVHRVLVESGRGAGADLSG